MKYSKQVFAFNSCSFLRLLFFTLFFLSEASYSCQNGSDDKIEQLSAQMAQISLDAKDEYCSDSEDEAGYQYKGFASLPKMKKNTSYVLISRGIHYSPDKFSREQISIWRRKNKAGKGIYAPAAYDLSGEAFVSTQDDAVFSAKHKKLKKLYQVRLKKREMRYSSVT